jgi:hypothetical protein
MPLWSLGDDVVAMVPERGSTYSGVREIIQGSHLAALNGLKRGQCIMRERPVYAMRQRRRERIGRQIRLKNDTFTLRERLR